MLADSDKRRSKSAGKRKKPQPRFTVVITAQYRSPHVRIRPLRQLVRFVLAAERVSEARVGVALVDDRTLQRLHRQFLGDERPSDVMSFRLSEPSEPIEIEVVISVQRAEREGPQHGLSAEQETWLYLIHGLLHQCGYGDHRQADRKRMWQRQEELLDQFCQRGSP